MAELGAYMRTHSLSRIEFVPLFLSPLIIVRRTNPRVAHRLVLRRLA